jgi:hypothetical protein
MLFKCASPLGNIVYTRKIQGFDIKYEGEVHGAIFSFLVNIDHYPKQLIEFRPEGTDLAFQDSVFNTIWEHENLPKKYYYKVNYQLIIKNQVTQDYFLTFHDKPLNLGELKRRIEAWAHSQFKTTLFKWTLSVGQGQMSFKLDLDSLLLLLPFLFLVLFFF